MSSALAWGVLVHSNQSFDFQTTMNLTKRGKAKAKSSCLLLTCCVHAIIIIIIIAHTHRPTFFSFMRCWAVPVQSAIRFDPFTANRFLYFSSFPPT
jgi:hypothetical protein